MDVGDFEGVPDATTVSLENQLLRTEVELLRARLGGIDREIAAIEREAESRVEAVRHQLAEHTVMSEEQYEELRRAQSDLKWVLRRIQSSPFGFVVARRPGFKKLAERHLD